MHSNSDSFRKLASSPKTDTLGSYKNVFPFLVLLTGFVSLVVLPSHRLVALLAYYIPDYMSASCHISFHRFALSGIHNGGEQEGFAMLAAEVAGDNVVEVCEVGLAILWRSSVKGRRAFR